jgi:hypothetical protein
MRCMHVEAFISCTQDNKRQQKFGSGKQAKTPKMGINLAYVSHPPFPRQQGRREEMSKQETLGQSQRKTKVETHANKDYMAQRSFVFPRPSAKVARVVHGASLTWLRVSGASLSALFRLRVIEASLSGLLSVRTFFATFFLGLVL